MTRKPGIPLLCRIGLHRKTASTTFYPSRTARIVTHYTDTVHCSRCPRVFSRETMVWDGQDYRAQGATNA